MLPSWADDTVIVLTATTTTVHGNVEQDWTNPAERPVAGCSVQPNPGTEDNDHRVGGLLVSHRLLMPAGDPITADNHVRWDGIEYEVVGAPQPWRVGNVQHVDVLLNYWRG